jgi:hypothetical protein
MSSPNFDVMPYERRAVVAGVCLGLLPVNVAFALLIFILVCLYNLSCSVVCVDI